MQKTITAGSFAGLANDLKRPFVLKPKEKDAPSLLLEDDLIIRYGMRRLTLEEKKLFPGLWLVIQMKKVRITKAPAVLPKAKDWVVWLVETYPGAYLVKLPGGANLLTPYNKMSWTAVSQDTPATTLIDVVEAERQRHWQGAFKRNIYQHLSV